MKHIKSIYFFIFFSFICYITAIVLTIYNTDYSLRWIIFFLWITSIFTFPIVLLIKNRFYVKEIINKFIKISSSDKLVAIFIASLAILLSFVFLVKYPFVSVYDQVRDGGLHAQEINNGIIKNIFGYGRYDSHGLIIPTITNFFYNIFKNSVLTFRLPTAIIAVLDIIILYSAVRKSINKETAFWSALVLASLPLHLYYARTEIVVIFSSFLTVLMILSLLFFIKSKKIEIFLFTGLLLGFASGFHTSARTVALFTFILVLILSFFSIKKYKEKIILGILVLITFYFIGFGPRILFTTPNIFFHASEAPLIKNHLITDKLSSEENNKKNFTSDLQQIAVNYKKSFLVYFKEPTMSTHYPDFKPLLPPLLGIFFIIGFLAILLLSKNILLKCVIAYSLFIPLSNSALTDMVNADNRLAPLFPIAAIIVGFGIQFIFSRLKKIKIIDKKTIFLFTKTILTLYILLQSFSFFVNESAAKLYSYYDYLTMHVIYDLKSDESYKEAKNICFYISPGYYNYLSPWHMLNRTQEQFEYFVPNKYFFIFQNNNISDNQVYISKSCNNNLEEISFTKSTHCSVYTKFLCPTNIRNPLEIYFENSTKKIYKDPNKFLNIIPPPLLIDPVPAFIP